MSDRKLPPRYSVPKLAPTAIAAQKAAKTGRFRCSPTDRGYGPKWDRLSIAFRKRHPFCQWCEQQGRDTLADLVDHMIPVQDRPDLVLEWKNLWSLCTFHHGKKFTMELFARGQGLLDFLPTWCRDPSSRPPQFR
jgi:5-methylcytosine-specific restriction endonuclease McrA